MQTLFRGTSLVDSTPVRSIEHTCCKVDVFEEKGSFFRITFTSAETELRFFFEPDALMKVAQGYANVLLNGTEWGDTRAFGTLSNGVLELVVTTQGAVFGLNVPISKKELSELVEAIGGVSSDDFRKS